MLLLFSSEIELDKKNNCKMNKLIIDAAKDKVFFMIIGNDINYNITYENSKNNYEKLTTLIEEFLVSKNIDLNRISQIYVNRGPGSFAGIRNSLSIVKAIHLVNKIDYYCFSFTDFHRKEILNMKIFLIYVKNLKLKNLINPIYMS